MQRPLLNQRLMCSEAKDGTIIVEFSGEPMRAGAAANALESATASTFISAKHGFLYHLYQHLDKVYFIVAS